MTQQTGAADYLELLTETRVVVYKFPDIVLYSNSEIRILKGKRTSIQTQKLTRNSILSWGSGQSLYAGYTSVSLLSNRACRTLYHQNINHYNVYALKVAEFKSKTNFHSILQYRHFVSFTFPINRVLLKSDSYKFKSLT